jgi:hypothetical protein
MLESLLLMNNIKALGPVVKLMRWFSWWEIEQYFSGECWATKFIMLWNTKNCSPTHVSSYVRPEESLSIPATGPTDKQELQQLKQKHGTWALAPLLITPTSMWQKDLIKYLGQPSWSHHASRAKDVLTAQQVALHTIQKCKSGWVDELYDLMVQGFLDSEVMKSLYPHQATSASTKKKRLEMHLDFIAKLVAKRSMSLVAQYLRPPIRYCPLWLASQQDLAFALETQLAMQKDWEKIST